MLFSVIVYSLILIALLSSFHRSLLQIKDIILFTIAFWFSFLMIAQPGFTTKIANFFGFQIASNFLFATSIFTLFVYILKLKFKIIIIERNMRGYINSTEIQKLRDIL